MNQPIAIQSWCFREFKPLPEFARQLKAAGVTATEVCNVHIDFTAPATWPGALDALREAGVTVVAIGVETLTGDADKDRPRFEFCKQAGVKNMSITFGPEALDDNAAALKRIDQMAGAYDLQLGIHNHGGYDWLGNDRILKHVFSKVSPRIGLHMDTAWAIDAKQNPVNWAQQFADRLCGIHVKDFIYDRERNPKDVIIGDGILDLAALMKVLREGHFTGPMVIEYEGDASDPVPVLKKCVGRLAEMM